MALTKEEYQRTVLDIHRIVNQLDERMDNIETMVRTIYARLCQPQTPKKDREIVIGVLSDVFKAMAGAIDMELSGKIKHRWVKDAKEETQR